MTPTITEDEIERMRALRREGRSYRQIAAITGRSHQAVMYWTNPEYRERKRHYAGGQPSRKRTPQQRQRRNEQRRKRYTTDPEYREEALRRERERKRARYATDPQFRAAKAADQRRRNQRKSETLARAERHQDIQRAVKKDGAALAEAYSAVSRLDQILGQARREATSNDSRRAINEAHASRDQMMEAIIRALGVIA